MMSASSGHLSAVFQTGVQSDRRKGNVVKEGPREITDLAFQMRTAWPRTIHLRYEKDILRDWFSAGIRAARKS